MQILTPEQEAHIPEYQEKWRKIYLSTEPIDREKAKAAIDRVYQVMGQKPPNVIFCQSPQEVLDALQSVVKFVKHLPSKPFNIGSFQWFKLIILTILKGIKVNQTPIKKISNQVSKNTYKSLREAIDRAIRDNKFSPEQATDRVLFSEDSLFKFISEKKREIGYDEIALFDVKGKPNPNYQLDYSYMPKNRLFQIYWMWINKKQLYAQIFNKITQSFGERIENCILGSLPKIKQIVAQPAIYTNTISYDWRLRDSFIWVDFASSVLNYPTPHPKKAALQNLLEQCGSIVVVDRTCIVCDRPTTVRVDDRYQLHANGAPALEFSDGFKVYACHGNSLPEKYGSIPIDRWEPQWVLEERDGQLQQILLGQIGASRIARELPTVELEALGEYTLLQLENLGRTYNKILKRTNAQTGEVRAEFVIKINQSIKAAIDELHNRGLAEEFPQPEPIDLDRTEEE